MTSLSHQKAPKVRAAGFTLIEVIVFIIVTSMVMSTILVGANYALRNSPTVHQQWVAIEAARGCLEYFLGQRRMLGYTSLSCPSTPSTAACIMPTGYTATANIACTTWNGDSGYKTITVTVSGLASASLFVQIGDS